MSSKERFEKTFSRKKNESPPSNNNTQKKKIIILNPKPKSPPPQTLINLIKSNKPKPIPASSNPRKPITDPEIRKKKDEKLNQKRKSDTHNAGPDTKKKKKKKKESVNEEPEKKEAVVGLAAVKKKESSANAEPEKKNKKKERKEKTVVVLKKDERETKEKPKPKEKAKTKEEGENGNVDGEKGVKKTAAVKRKEKESNEEEEGVGVVFPTARISRIVKSEGSDYRLSSEAVFLINKASEKFIELFSEDAYGCAVEDRKRSILYKHLSSVVCKGKRFDFLSDFVPEKVTAEKALAATKSTEKLPGKVSQISASGNSAD